MEKQIVIFELDGERYGVQISAVESIIKMPAITRVPNAPEFMEGVTNLRGKVLPVIDLRRRFGLPYAAARAESRIVVATLNDLEVGMVVDGVSEVLTITTEAVEPPPAMVTSIGSEFIQGIAKIDTRLVILLDLNRVLTAAEQTQARQTYSPAASLQP